jgi:predicted nucleic acid-binding protein
MPYLLDTDVFIRAKRDHYRFGTFPCFWDWIVAQHEAGIVFSVEAVEQEILNGHDELSAWIARIDNAFLAVDEATTISARTLSAWVQDPARIYTPAAINAFFSSADYWLIAHAAAHGFTVVTHELPDPNRRNRVKIPDACSGIGVSCMNTFDMLHAERAQFTIDRR